MSTTILTDEQIRDLAGTGETSMRANNDMMLARAVEQAVLQSEQVQAWKRDAERYRWLKERNSGPIGIVAWHRDEDKEMVLTDGHADETIDAAMERKT